MPAPTFLTRAGSYLCTTVHHAIHAAIEQLLERHARPGGSLLDVGCWDGGRTVRYRDAGRLTSLHGVEIDSAQAAAATTRGIDVARCDLESPAFPWANGSIDVVVCNQVLEHLKNVFAVMEHQTEMEVTNTTNTEHHLRRLNAAAAIRIRDCAS